MATKTSPRRAARKTNARIVRCDVALAALLGLTTPARPQLKQ